MELMRLAAILATGMICGWLGGIFTRGSGFGLWGNMLAAVIGALGAVYLMRYVGLGHDSGPFAAALISATGAVLTLAAIGWLRR
jgi:uncharacterized membrane protein YeaQ/YmgE (transglycosylase-associated protein family)